MSRGPMISLAQWTLLESHAQSGNSWALQLIFFFKLLLLIRITGPLWWDPWRSPSDSHHAASGVLLWLGLVEDMPFWFVSIWWYDALYHRQVLRKRRRFSTELTHIVNIFAGLAARRHAHTHDFADYTCWRYATIRTRHWCGLINNSLRPGDAYMRRKTNHHWLR